MFSTHLQGQISNPQEIEESPPSTLPKLTIPPSPHQLYNCFVNNHNILYTQILQDIHDMIGDKNKDFIDSQKLQHQFG